MGLTAAAMQKQQGYRQGDPCPQHQLPFVKCRHFTAVEINNVLYVSQGSIKPWPWPFSFGFHERNLTAWTLESCQAELPLCQCTAVRLSAGIIRLSYKILSKVTALLRFVVDLSAVHLREPNLTPFTR